MLFYLIDASWRKNNNVLLVFLFADLIHMSNDSKVSMPVLADLLADRFRVNNWIVAFKALITSHNLMTLGNEVIVT